MFVSPLLLIMRQLSKSSVSVIQIFQKRLWAAALGRAAPGCAEQGFGNAGEGALGQVQGRFCAPRLLNNRNRHRQEHLHPSMQKPLAGGPGACATSQKERPGFKPGRFGEGAGRRSVTAVSWFRLFWWFSLFRFCRRSFLRSWPRSFRPCGPFPRQPRRGCGRRVDQSAPGRLQR
jgi:hypothetical protein